MNNTETQINIQDITVVVQGAINEEYTKKCLKSIRKYLPRATIILSTWEGSNVEDLDYDKLILNKDPGPSGSRNPHEPNFNLRINDNTNRQILSTKNGLKEVKTKYAMKLRTDFVLTGKHFLKYFSKFNKHIDYDSKLKLFEKRILILGYATVNCNIPFWIGDFFSFGQTKDMLKLWDIDLMDDATINYFNINDIENLSNNEAYQFIKLTHRYFAEPYIFVKCIAKNIPEIYNIFKNYTDITEENIELSKKLIANNFVALDTNLLNVEPLKEALLGLKQLKCFYNWQLLYQKYCDKNYKIPLTILCDCVFLNFLKNTKEYVTLKKHYKYFYNPIEKTIKWFFMPIRIIYDIFKLIKLLIKKIIIKG